MDLGLRGQAALVAAASSGLGLGVARALAAEGAHVSICARDPGRLAKAHKEVEEAGPGRVISVALDLADSGAVTDWVERTAAELGGLHIVVTNSPGVPHGPADAFTVDEYRESIDGVMLAHIAITRAAIPHLSRAGWGRILMITSESVLQPLIGTALSATARLGVLGYAKSLVPLLGPRGITVNVLAPGCHATPSFEGFVAARGGSRETALKEITGEIPARRVGSPSDFGAVAAFLASGQAAFITGTVLPVDGGNSRGI